MKEDQVETIDIETLSPENSGAILNSPQFAARKKLINILALLLATDVVAFIICLCRSSAPENHNNFALIILISIGSVLFISCSALSANSSRNRYLWRLARQAVKTRPDKLFDPENPLVRFVEIVPKSSWSGNPVMGAAINPTDNAIEVGLLLIDHERRLILYEGEDERYRIPAGAIMKCERDSYTRLQQDPSANTSHNLIVPFYFVVLTVKTSGDATVELPFRIRMAKGRFNKTQQLDANIEFWRDIQSLAKARKAAA